MSKKIALCFNTPGMDMVKWTSKDYGKKYPGAGWMKWLPVLNNGKDPLVIDGKNALDGSLNPKDLIIIQEENNEFGAQLMWKGADPRIVMCLESPIFTRFYDTQCDNFRYRLLFDKGTDHLYFPSFDDDDIKDPMPLENRKFLCMVTANKHYSVLFKPTDSKSFDEAMEGQLHDYRYKAIGYFIGRDGFKLYGKGWPLDWDAECADKISTIRKYKFSLCFENGAYPGYVTEKIIDCLVAGVIPVYYGAPDIDEYVPSGLFINARMFTGFDAMEEFLKNFPQWQAEQMIKVGQDWLRTGAGRRHNNKVFATRMLRMCE